MKRNIEEYLVKDLERKMVFLSGPRQVGKTTLAKGIINIKKGRYLSYDDVDDRNSILKREFVTDRHVCLDEFHKYNRWKGLIKGVYDKYGETLHLILSGSARLDIYQKSGDSLVGRYYLHHLHPLTLAELYSKKISMPENILEPSPPLKGLDDLLQFGGFPEPFILASETEHRRWSSQRRQLLVREELRDLTQVQLLSVIENLMLLLPEKIGNLFSYTSLAEDLRVSIPTVSEWMKILENLYFVYKLPPYSKKVIRSIQKRPKYYLWDWSQLSGEPQLFENCIASHLFKSVSVWNDIGLVSTGLYYIHDRNGREVDFLLCRENKPWFLVEVKISEDRISSNLRYFTRRFSIPGIQILKKEGICRKEGNILVISADRWLGHLV